jgi:AraC-like DNA-binding protein/ligand-binding sensor protein
MHDFIERVAQSEMFRRYEQAFAEVTGLALALRPADSRKLPFRGKARENRFCALMAENGATCARCLNAQETLFGKAHTEPAMLCCGNGLHEVAVPIEFGNEPIAFLRTGQVADHPATAADLERVEVALKELGMSRGRKQILEAFEQTPVVPMARLQGIIQLLKSFAELLSDRITDISMLDAHAEPFIVTRAKEFVLAHPSQHLSLHDVAAAINVSSFHLCKTFKTATGIHFTEFISRVRVEKARKLLLNPNLRMSEIAYDSGFQSITHFNRMFRRLLGISPTAFRARTMQWRATMPAGFHASKSEANLAVSKLAAPIRASAVP